MQAKSTTIEQYRLHNGDTGSADVQVALLTERINHLIRGLKKALTVTSIVVTHDMKSAFSISDRMAMVQAGEIILQGTPQEFERSNDPRVENFIRGIAPVNEDVETLLRA